MLGSQKGNKGFLCGVDSTNLPQNQSWIESPSGTYHPLPFHQQKPNLLQQRSEECSISLKKLKQISFSSRQIKLYTRKYLM